MKKMQKKVALHNFLWVFGDAIIDLCLQPGCMAGCLAWPGLGTPWQGAWPGIMWPLSRPPQLGGVTQLTAPLCTCH